MIVIDFGLGRVSALIGDVFSSDDASHRTVEVFPLQMKYDHIMAQLSNITPECLTFQALAQERGHDTFKLRASLDASEDAVELHEDHIAGAQNKKEL